jgi:hypothetical protein
MVPLRGGELLGGGKEVRSLGCAIEDTSYSIVSWYEMSGFTPP